MAANKTISHRFYREPPPPPTRRSSAKNTFVHDVPRTVAREKTHPLAASERDHIRPIFASFKWEALSFMNILPRRPFTTKRTRNGRGKSIPGGSCSRQVVIVFDAVLPARYTIHQTKLPSLIFRVRELNSIVAAADGDILHQQIPLLPFGISTPQGGDAVEQTFARVLI